MAPTLALRTGTRPEVGLLILPHSSLIDRAHRGDRSVRSYPSGGATMEV